MLCLAHSHTNELNFFLCLNLLVHLVPFKLCICQVLHTAKCSFIAESHQNKLQVLLEIYPKISAEKYNL